MILVVELILLVAPCFGLAFVPSSTAMSACAQVAFNMRAADRSFRNITLSFRGSERQAPSSLQLALRFSKILEQYEQEGRHHAQMTVDQRLQDAVDEFNQTPGLQAKHRIEDDRFKAVSNLLSGTCEVAGLCFGLVVFFLR